jgi:tetratricopeptide (TPR) repeat protein
MNVLHCFRILTALVGLLVLSTAGVTALAQETASDLAAKAERLKATGDKSGAIAAYRESLRLDPRQARVQNELGTLLFEAGQTDAAIDAFKQAVAADPGFALAYYNLGFAARKVERYADAAAAYQRYVQLKPDDPDGKYGLAESLRGMGKKEQAIEAYEAYVRQETRPSEQQWVEKARAQIQALRVAPPAQTVGSIPSPVKVPTAAEMIARGDAYFNEHQQREALRSYQEAVRLEPNNALAHFKLGLAYASLDFMQEAIAQWQEVLRLDPGNRGAQDNIDRARSRQGSAQAQAQAATPPSVGDPTVAQQTARQSYDEAVQLISQRRYAEAVTALTRAIQLRPDFAVAYVARGSAYVGLGRYQDAVQEYLKGLNLNPNQAAPLFGLGEAYRGMNDRSRAARYYQECAQSNAPDAASLRDLARRRYGELVQ